MACVTTNQTSEFEGCAIPPVLYGTGTLLFRDPATGEDENAGNFRLVSIVGEGEPFRVFLPGEQKPSVLSVKTAYRIEASGDSFSMANLSRLWNEPQISVVDGTRLNLTTVSVAPSRQVVFQKPLLDECGFVCSMLELVLWRAHVNVPFDYNFDQLVSTEHTFDLIALPDAIDHPNTPFGCLQLVCPAVPS
jgi:hypothetical protein